MPIIDDHQFSKSSYSTLVEKFKTGIPFLLSVMQDPSSRLVSALVNQFVLVYQSFCAQIDFLTYELLTSQNKIKPYQTDLNSFVRREFAIRTEITRTTDTIQLAKLKNKMKSLQSAIKSLSLRILKLNTQILTKKNEIFSSFKNKFLEIQNCQFEKQNLSIQVKNLTKAQLISATFFRYFELYFLPQHEIVSYTRRNTEICLKDHAGIIPKTVLTKIQQDLSTRTQEEAIVLLFNQLIDLKGRWVYSRKIVI